MTRKIFYKLTKEPTWKMFEFEDLTDEQLKELAKLDTAQKDKIYKRQLEYYRRNSEQEKQRMRDWYANNKERKAEYYQKNRERLDSLTKESHANHPDYAQITALKRNLNHSMTRVCVGHRGRVTPSVLVRILKEELAGRVRNYLDKSNMKKKILCIVGESGTGKTLSSLHLKYQCGANVICSYTTRPPRDTEVEGRDHHFIDIVPPEDELLAYAEFGMYKYYATKAQVYGPCTVYVIDEQGIRDLLERHSDEYDVYSVYITREKKLRRERGIAESRMKRDEKRKLLDLSFYNYVIENNGTKRELFLNIERIYNEVKNK